MAAGKSRNRNSRAVVLSRKTSFRGKVFSVTSERILEPNGVTYVRDVVRHSGSVVILAVDDSEGEPHILLERQYRYAAGQDLWEIPAGRKDKNETPLAGAKRELREETGYTARLWRKALFFYPSPGFVDETMTVFLALDLKPGTAQPEEDEKIEYELVPLLKVLKMISSGEIKDGKTIAAVLWFREWEAQRPADTMSRRPTPRLDARDQTI